MNTPQANSSPKIVIAGGDSWYNRGDFAILTGTIHLLQAEFGAPMLVILTDRPDITQASFPFTEAVNRRDPRQVRKALNGAQAALWGGGHLIQNMSSQIFMVAQMGVLAQLVYSKVPTMSFAIGAEPMDNRLLNLLVRQVASKLNVITVRDERSKEAFKSYGITKPVEVVADPAIVLRPSPHTAYHFPRPYVVVSPRKWFHYHSSWVPVRWQTEKPQQTNAHFEAFRNILIQTCNWLVNEQKMDVVFVPMYPGVEQGDEVVCRSILEKMDQPVHGHLAQDMPPGDVLSIIQGAELAIAVRMHASILAACSAVPAVGLYYQQKGLSFFEALQMERFAFPIDQIDFSTLRGAVAELLSQRATYSEHLIRRRDVLTGQAYQAVKIVRSLVDGGK